jgi:hypothetical protein
LERIINHIKDTAATNKFQNLIHQPSDLYKLETSFIHHPEEQTVILILHVPFVEAENLLPIYKFISLPIYFNFSSKVSIIPDVVKLALPKLSKLYSLLIWPIANVWVRCFSAKDAPFFRPTSFRTALALSISGAPP